MARIGFLGFLAVSSELSVSIPSSYNFTARSKTGLSIVKLDPPPCGGTARPDYSGLRTFGQTDWSTGAGHGKGRCPGRRVHQSQCRVGMAQDLVKSGVELPALMKAGRCKGSKMPSRYTERQSADRGAVAGITKLKPRWDVHLSGVDDQLGCAGKSLSSVLGE